MSVSGTHSHGRMRWKPWVIPTHQPGHNSTTSESCGQSKVQVTGCTVCPRQTETLSWAQSPPSESRQEMGPGTSLETWLETTHQGQNLRKHISSMALTRKGHLACPEMGFWTHTQKVKGGSMGGYSGQLMSRGVLWVLTLN